MGGGFRGEGGGFRGGGGGFGGGGYHWHPAPYGFRPAFFHPWMSTYPVYFHGIPGRRFMCGRLGLLEIMVSPLVSARRGPETSAVSCRGSAHCGDALP